jgi:Lon protease-like protein
MSDVNPLPLFPLEIVLFPGEKLPLHIFEPRYKEMLNECLRDGHSFGIVCYINKRLSTVGCIYDHIEVVNRYDDGRMDIIGRGSDRFLIHSFSTTRSFLQGTVTYFHDQEDPLHSGEVQRLMSELEPMFLQMLEYAKEETSVHSVTMPKTSYEFAHYIGFDLSQKQNLLEIKSEYLRLLFIQTHMNSILPKLQAFDETRARIRSNGHFREFPPIQFNLE